MKKSEVFDKVLWALENTDGQEIKAFTLGIICQGQTIMVTGGACSYEDVTNVINSLTKTRDETFK